MTSLEGKNPLACYLKGSTILCDLSPRNLQESSHSEGLKRVPPDTNKRRERVILVICALRPRVLGKTF